jgi:hypothetical protein
MTILHTLRYQAYAMNGYNFYSVCGYVYGFSGCLTLKNSDSTTRSGEKEAKTFDVSWL